MLVVAEREQLPVTQAKAGNPDAWDILFKRYQLPLYVYVHELICDEQSSLDIVQETFISAVRHIASLRDNDKFGGWLFGIAHQKCIQIWRKNNRNAAAMEEIADESTDFEEDPVSQLIRREREEEFMKLLNQLPWPQRSVLLLFFIEEFSLQEIAAITDASLGTVKSRLHYGRKAFRKLWGENLA